MKMTPNEIAKFEQNYEKGEHDKCWEWQSWCLNVGYGGFYMRRGKRHTFMAHRLAWSIANNRDAPDGMLICHHCDNRKCVNPAHLYLGTSQDNNRDTIKRNRGNRTLGENCSWAKLTNQDVLDIRASTESQATIARRYGVDQGHISAIINRKRWIHI